MCLSFPPGLRPQAAVGARRATGTTGCRRTRATRPSSAVRRTSTISVSLNGSEMAGGLSFSSSSNHGYAIVPGSGARLTLSNTAASIPVTVVSGTHSISAPIILDESLAVSVSGRAALQISGNLSESVTGAALSLTGGGELILSGSDSFNGGTNVEAGTLIVTNNEALPAGISLTVGAGGTLIFRSFGVRIAQCRRRAAGGFTRSRGRGRSRAGYVGAARRRRHRPACRPVATAAVIE